MSGNAQKVALGRAQNEFARKKALDAIAATGKGLPCSIVSIEGWVATVKFEVEGPYTLPNLTVPVASSLYDYLPLREGDPGVVRPADARLGGLSGLGGGTAKWPATVGNLSALVFDPFGNKEWEGPEDPEMRVVQGPAGVIVRDLDGETTVTVTPDSIVAERGAGKATIADDRVELELGGAKIRLEDGKVYIEGELFINDEKYLEHEHTGVTTGGGQTGGVAP